MHTAQNCVTSQQAVKATLEELFLLDPGHPEAVVLRGPDGGGFNYFHMIGHATEVCGHYDSSWRKQSESDMLYGVERYLAEITLATSRIRRFDGGKIVHRKIYF